MKANLKRAFLQPSFWLAVLFSMAGLTIHTWPDMQTNWQNYRSAEYYSSALQLTLQPIYFGGFILAFIVAAAFCAAGGLVDDYRENTCLYEWSRLGARRYFWIKALSGAVCGGSAATLGFLLHAAFCYTLFLPCNPVRYEAHVLPLDDTLYAHVYGLLGGLPMVAGTALGIFIASSAWALLSLACASWIPDKIIAVSAPVMIYYLWLWGGLRMMVPFFQEGPTSLFNDGLTKAVLVNSLYQHAVLAAVGLLLLRAGIRRRIRNA